MTRRTKNRAIAITITLVGMAMTAFLGGWIERSQDRQAAQRFETQVTSSGKAAIHRLATFSNVLRGLAALRTTAPDEVGGFIKQLSLDTNYPGLRGVAFTEPGLTGLGESWNFSDYSQLPAGLFNRKPIADAFQEARFSQTVVVSPPVELLSPTGEGRLGFLMVLRLPSTGPETEVRYVVAVFDSQHFFSSALSGWPSLVHVELTDFDGKTYFSRGANDADFESVQVVMPAAGEDWTLAFSAPLELFGGNSSLSSLVSLLGFSLSALLGFVFWRQGEGRERAEHLVDELRRSDDALRKNAGMLAANEERYRSLFDFNPDAVFSLTPHGRFESVNQAAEHLAGYSEEQLLRMTFQDLIEADFLPLTVDKFQLSLSGVAQDFETTIRNSEHRSIVVNVKVVPILVGGRIIGVYGIAKDITDRKRFDDALKLLSEASANLTETLEPDALMNGMFSLLVPAHATKAAACIQEEGVTRSYATDERLKGSLDLLPLGTETKVYAPDELDHMPGLFVLDQPLLDGGVPFGRLVLLRGTPFDALDIAMLGDLSYRIASAIDNAHLYQAANLAVQARDEFLSIASHELKTPLTSLLLRLEMLREQLRGPDKKDPADLDTALDAMVTQVSRLAKLVHEMLAVTRLMSGKLSLEPEFVDFGDFVSGVVAAHRDTALKAGISFQLDTQSITGYVDPRRLSQAIEHLVSNALKYGEGNPVSVSLYADETQVHISVCDHGRGISEADVQRIFGRFEKAIDIRRHSSGLGMGLYVTRKIVEAHGGTIDVVSRPGEGATFIIHLPLVPIQAASVL